MLVNEIVTYVGKYNRYVWHKSSMKKGVIPRSAGIDTDARW
jgi:hypothetical protein